MKKYIAKQNLEESIAQKPTGDECPAQCGVHFFGSSCARDSHRSLYPDHFTGAVLAKGKVEAALVENLKGKITHRKRGDKHE